jgi:hypothetical protein
LSRKRPVDELKVRLAFGGSSAVNVPVRRIAYGRKQFIQRSRRGIVDVATYAKFIRLLVVHHGPVDLLALNADSLP